MKILSKHKDYWHYVAGIYGEDPKIIYNLHNSYGVIDHKPEEKMGYHGTYIQYPSDLRLCICGTMYYGIWHQGKYQWDIETLGGIFMGDIKNSNHDHSLLVRHLFEPSKHGTYWGSWYYSSKKQFDKAIVANPGRPTNINDKYKEPIIWLKNTKTEQVELNPILIKTNIISIIPAEDMFLKVTDWLSYQEPEIKLDPTDMLRLESKGFDKKTSFRKM